jgi:hypothetical protein
MSINSFDESFETSSQGSSTQSITNLTIDSENVRATNLVNELRARGVTFRLTGNRLQVSPWKRLTTEEQHAVRQEREAIKAIVRAQPEKPHHAIAVANQQPAPAPQPEPTKCAYCGCAPCVGESHPHFRVLHASSPEEIERRSLENTAVMLKMMTYRHTYVY